MPDPIHINVEITPIPDRALTTAEAVTVVMDALCDALLPGEGQERVADLAVTADPRLSTLQALARQTGGALTVEAEPSDLAEELRRHSLPTGDWEPSQEEHEECAYCAAPVPDWHEHWAQVALEHLADRGRLAPDAEPVDLAVDPAALAAAAAVLDEREHYVAVDAHRVARAVLDAAQRAAGDGTQTGGAPARIDTDDTAAVAGPSVGPDGHSGAESVDAIERRAALERIRGDLDPYAKGVVEGALDDITTLIGWLRRAHARMAELESERDALRATCRQLCEWTAEARRGCATVGAERDDLRAVAAEHDTCPVHCPLCDETLAATVCQRCSGIGDVGGGASVQCPECAGVGRLHEGCAEASYADLVAERDRLRQQLDQAEWNREHLIADIQAERDQAQNRAAELERQLETQGHNHELQIADERANRTCNCADHISLERRRHAANLGESDQPVTDYDRGVARGLEIAEFVNRF